MHEEMKSLHKNNTYELIELPKGKRALKNKWVLKRNHEPNISQPRYKTRLVVKGFSQDKDIDFEEIFSPVVKMSSIRVVLGLVASMNLKIEQFDVKIAFLHDIETMVQEVCSFMVEHGYDRAALDHYVFVKKLYDGEFIIFLLYVDDMLIVGRDTSKIDNLKKELSKSFEMKDLGLASQILGKAKPVSSPLGSHLKLSSKQSPSSEKEKKEMRKVPYALAVSSLMYVMVCTRPDIAHAIGVVRCTGADMTGDVDLRKSTFEAEYIAIIEASKELLWMKKFLQELGLQQERYSLYCDSQSVIHLRTGVTAREQ
ncbi:Retrovirus-related Pol polyprotein from transposon TNT 1-94 [Vitis vinifera]|uniref:Retrovirus-related Pol polyprotein from transposon TNT 1-94 n=1 Tax=Vitis vinifera TaxID=29760 RepID=A0A438GXV7_VITVI|nr:Retrovirus-related Pol polyprotein from transposon TNT 1-94 [Vitis vinifera]